MIYYPVSTLIAAGIRELLIISTPGRSAIISTPLGNGNQWGCTITYAEQAKPRGLADAFLVGENFIDQSPVVLILGDNLFHGTPMTQQLSQHHTLKGGHIFAYKVKDPERYGVVQFDHQNKVIDIEEKPLHPKTSYAVPGIYLYDATVVEKRKH